MKESTKKMATVQFVKKRKPTMSAAERKRQAESLRTYRPGGDDAS